MFNIPFTGLNFGNFGKSNKNTVKDLANPFNIKPFKIDWSNFPPITFPPVLTPPPTFNVTPTPPPPAPPIFVPPIPPAPPIVQLPPPPPPPPPTPPVPPIQTFTPPQAAIVPPQRTGVRGLPTDAAYTDSVVENLGTPIVANFSSPATNALVASGEVMTPVSTMNTGERVSTSGFESVFSPVAAPTPSFTPTPPAIGASHLLMINGPYADECAAFAAQGTGNPVGVYVSQDMGDNFVHQQFYGSAPSFSQSQPVYNGANQWYWIDGAAVKIGYDGRKLGATMVEPARCRPKVETPTGGTIKLKFQYAAGFGAPNTFRVNSSVDSLDADYPSIKTKTLHYPAATTTSTKLIATWGAEGQGGKDSTWYYKLEQLPSLYGNDLRFQLYQKTSPNDQWRHRGSNEVTQFLGTTTNGIKDLQFDEIPFNGLVFVFPTTKELTVAPTIGTVGRDAGQFNLSITSTSDFTLAALNGGDWISIPKQGSKGTSSNFINFQAGPVPDGSGTTFKRTATVRVTNTEGLTRDFTIVQQYEQPPIDEPPKPDPTRLTIQLFYDAGANANGKVDTITSTIKGLESPRMSGDPATDAIAGNSKTYGVARTASVSWNPKISQVIGSVNGIKNGAAASKERYVLKLDGYNLIILENNKTFGTYPLGEYGGTLRIKDEVGHVHLPFSYGKIELPPDPKVPPILKISQSTERGIDNWGTLNIHDVGGAVVRKFPLGDDDWHSTNYQTILDRYPNFSVSVEIKNGILFEKCEQTSPNGISIPLELITKQTLLGYDTTYEWEFTLSRKVEESKQPQVFPAFTTVEFNTAGDTRVDVPYTTRDASYISIRGPKGFRGLDNLPTAGSFTLKSSFFTQGVGRYEYTFCPYGPKGEKGTEKTVIVNVVSKSITYFPDIRKINYPKEIKGADFIGLDVPFSFSYQSVFTDYVRIWLHDKSTPIGFQHPKQSLVKLNVKDLIKYTNKFTKKGDIYTFKFLLQPFGKGEKESLEGKREEIVIKFDEGDLKLNRNKVIKDLCDAVARNLNEDAFDEFNSKYLNHLVHFGSANNEVISNWEVDTETFRKYEIDPLTKRPTNKQVDGEGFDALVLKLYEPLNTTVQPNQQVWITKIQSQPQVHEVILRDSDKDYCPPLAAPNFSLDVSSGMGYELFDEMLASGTNSNASLVNTFVSQSGIDTKKLDISYISGAVTYNSQSLEYESSSQVIAWDRFSHFGSGEERIKNFWYKVSSIENYNNVSASLETSDNASTSLTVVAEKERQIRKINEIIAGFDGFEEFLYTDTGSLSYPKNSNGILLSTGSSDAINWYDVTGISGSKYDYYNPNYLPNNIPQFVKDDKENADFILFLDMIGHHFDILWAYTENINRARKLEHKKLNNGVSDELVREMLRSFGYQPKSTMDTAPLWEFALGQYNNQNQARTDGTTSSIMTGKQRQNQIWRRILNNLPYIYKSKGTSRGLKAILSTYGISEGILRIQEFGGPPPTNISQPTQYTETVDTFALKTNSNSFVTIPWHSGSSYPHTIEFSVQTEEKEDAVIFRNDQMYLELIHDTGSLAKFKFHISGSGTAESVTTETLPFFSDTINSFMVRRTYSSGSVNEIFDIFAKEPFQERIRAQVSASVQVAYGESGWESGSEIVFGGFSASIDNIKLWRTALSESIFDEHVLAPDMYNGNSISSSTEDLFIRLDFEKAENIAESSSFSPSGSYQNTAPSADTLYGEQFVSMSGFITSSTYPFGSFEKKTVERTRVVPATGLAAADKVRLTTQNVDSELSPFARATKSGLKNQATDSDRIGIFISPTNNINRDITKALGGTFKIDDFIGDPCSYYDEDYNELKAFRRKFFKKYTINYDGFYNLVKYIDNTLFDAIGTLLPGRSKTTTGLLIEPHLLERNKQQRKRPSGIIFEELVGTEDISKNSIISISSSTEPITAVLTSSVFTPDFDGSEDYYETTLDYSIIDNISGSHTVYETTMDYDFVDQIGASHLSVEGLVTGSNRATPVSTTILSNNNNEGSLIFNIPATATGSATGQYVRDMFETIPADDNGDYYNEGYGITAKNGHSIVTFLTPNGRDKERRKYYMITKNVTDTFPILNNSSDQTSGTTDTAVTSQKKILTYVSISGSAPAVGGDIVTVQPVDGNLGSHYIYTKDTSTGLENSYFNGCKQTQATTIDGGPAFETFVTNPNTLKVSDSGRGSGEPILDVE